MIVEATPPAEPTVLGDAQHCQVTLHPELGGAIGRYGSKVDSRWIDWLRPAPSGCTSVQQMGAFPLLPFSNRIRDGRFAFGNACINVGLNCPGLAHAMHGHGWQRRWTLQASEPLGHLTVYTPHGQDFFCVEPVSHCTDAFNLAAAGDTRTGMRVIEPGERLSATVTFIPG